MKIIATNKTEFCKLEELIKSKFSDDKMIDTVEYHSLLETAMVTMHRVFEKDFKIAIPSKWGFWKVYTTERNEETEGKSQIAPRYTIRIICKDMTLVYPSSSCVYSLEIYKEAT
jgi:hypothetical protein